MPTFARFWLPIAFGAALLHASDVAVVVDVSGTMGRYGKWQPEVLDLIEALTTGAASPANLKFNSTGEAAAAAQFKLAPGESITLLKFGSVQSDAYPFFTAAQKVANAQELRGIFPNSPAAFREKLTNKELAFAVGARLAGNSPSRMIAISDFLSDADLSQQQQEYINQFQSQSKLETPIIYTWLTDKRVLVKLMVATGKSAPPPVKPPEKTPEKTDETPKEDHQVQIVDAHEVEGHHKFAWRVVPNAEAKSFRLTIRDAKTRKVVLEQPGLATTSASVIDPSPGDYFAVVTAELSDGSQATSRPYPVKVEGSYGAVIFTILGLAVLVAALWFFMRRANQRKADPNMKEGVR